MSFDEEAVRIMIFLSEDDRLHRHSLHEILLKEARNSGVIGASVWRGIEGFGAAGHVRTRRFPDAITGLPIVVELIDSAEHLDTFLAKVSELAPGSLVTRESIRISRVHSDVAP